MVLTYVQVFAYKNIAYENIAYKNNRWLMDRGRPAESA